MKLYKESDTDDMALQIQRFLLGYLEMWIFSTRLVLTFWFVTIGMVWSLTFGSMIDLKNKSTFKTHNTVKNDCNLREMTPERDSNLESDNSLPESDQTYDNKFSTIQETNSTSNSITKDKTKTVEMICNNGVERYKELNASVSYDDAHKLYIITNKNIAGNTSTAQNFENQRNVKSIGNFRNTQKHFTSINALNRRGKIIGMNGAIISRYQSHSSPELVRKSRTVSEKEEEDDKLTPLPKLKRTRNWRSSGSLSASSVTISSQITAGAHRKQAKNIQINLDTNASSNEDHISNQKVSDILLSKKSCSRKPLSLRENVLQRQIETSADNSGHLANENVHYRSNVSRKSHNSPINNVTKHNRNNQNDITTKSYIPRSTLNRNNGQQPRQAIRRYTERTEIRQIQNRFQISSANR